MYPGGLCLSQTSKDARCSGRINNVSGLISSGSERRGASQLSHSADSLVQCSDICLVIGLSAGRLGAGAGYTKGIFRNYYRLGDKQDVPFFKGCQWQMGKPSARLKNQKEGEQAGHFVYLT